MSSIPKLFSTASTSAELPPLPIVSASSSWKVGFPFIRILPSTLLGSLLPGALGSIIFSPPTVPATVPSRIAPKVADVSIFCDQSRSGSSPELYINNSLTAATLPSSIPPVIASELTGLRVSYICKNVFFSLSVAVDMSLPNTFLYMSAPPIPIVRPVTIIELIPTAWAFADANLSASSAVMGASISPVTALNFGVVARA